MRLAPMFAAIPVLGGALFGAACTTAAGDASTSDSDLTARSEVVFSPQAVETSHLARVVDEIEEARVSIDIAMYSFADPKIESALKDAARRGVKIRFLFNEAPADQRLPESERKRSASGKLEGAGIDVRFVNKVMHHKFMIVDGARDDLAKAKTASLVTGSANWSNAAATRFDENTLVFKSSESLLLQFQREFDLMWSHSRDFSSTTTPFAHELASTTIVDDAIPSSPNLRALFTSANFSVKETTFSTTGENTVANALVAAIEGAKTSIHVASGHLRSRPVSEALIAKKKADPTIDIRVYLDGQEFIAKGTHEIQLRELDSCLEEAGESEAKRRNCTDKGFLFGYAVGDAGIDVRYKYYAYRWDHSYAPQMHHKYMIVDGTTLFSGSYNLSDNAEHDTFENMIMVRENPSLVRAFEENFETIWNTGREEKKLDALLARIEQAPSFPLVFEPMALTWSEVTNLKTQIRANCPAVDSETYRRDAQGHTSCSRAE